MKYYFDIENTRDSSTNSVLLVGIKSISFDNNGCSRTNLNPFSRLTIKYLNDSIEHITFKDNELDYGNKIYLEIKSKSEKMIEEITKNGNLGSLFK